MTESVRSIISQRPIISRQESRAAALEVSTVPCNMIRTGDSPRLAGENREHIKMLAESIDEFPPILVHRSSMRIIDGMHRLQATRLCGRREIDVRFFDGEEEDIFIVSVRENNMHGLPLSLADRKAAAVRIVEAHSDWSDRLIASITGLSHKTIATIRSIPGRAIGENTQLHARRGHDGRVRPLSSSEGRRLAADLLKDDPTASLRAVARKAGISPGTVRDVRDRLKRGMDPVLGQQEHNNGTATADRVAPMAAQLGRSSAKDAGSPPKPDMTTILQRLRSDPALRFSETGRSILRHLHYSTDNAIAFGRFVDKIPHHRAATIAELAWANAELWQHIAVQLQRRSC